MGFHGFKQGIFYKLSSRRGKKAVIFEPFVSRTHTETLIWRRGDELWDTPEHYIDTLVSLSERTMSDVIFADMRLFDFGGKRRLLEYISHKDFSPRGFGIITDSSDDIAFAEESGADVIAAYGDIKSKALPTIRMDGDIENAILLGYDGWYASDSAKEYLTKYGDKIRVLGGLGVKWVEGSSPMEIYTEVGEIHKQYGSSWACGSGGEISSDKYLELISLLGAFGRIR